VIAVSRLLPRHPEFILEQPDLLRDARLRGVERFGGFGYVEAATLDFDNVTQLLQLHGSMSPFGYNNLTEYSFSIKSDAATIRPP